MIFNYLKLSFRLMARNPFFTFINVVGLAIGFASFYALWNYSTSELKSDQYHQDFERIARIGMYWRWTDDGGKNWKHSVSGCSQSFIPERAKQDFAEVEDFTRIHPQIFFGPTSDLVRHDREITLSTVDKKEVRVFKEEHVVYADQNLFNFFSIPLLRGKASEVLKDAGSVVISESRAIKYFGQENPVGELMKLNDTITLKVTGVFKDLPHNTHLTFNIVISNAANLNAWGTAFNPLTFNYVKLRTGNSFDNFEKKLKKRVNNYVSHILQNITNTEIDPFVQPLKDIAFSENILFDGFKVRSKSLLLTFAVISVVLLSMAWVNYINLWVARNKKREKELATRKINGARAKDIVIQFLIESLIINCISFFLAMTFLQIVRIPAKDLFDIEINPIWQLDPGSLSIIAIFLFSSIAVTGLYPALVSSARQPLKLLKNTTPENSRNIFSSGLLVAQYASAVALILWSSIVYFELNHILEHEIGLDRENVVEVELPSGKNAEGRIDGIMRNIAANPRIAGAAYSLFTPVNSAGTINTRRSGSFTQVGFEWNGVSEQYLPFFGLKIVAGRNFVSDDRADGAIITDVAAMRLGFQNPADAVGTKLELLKNESSNDWPAVEVIGICKDYRTVPFFATSAVEPFDNPYQSQGKIFFYKNRGFEQYSYKQLSIKILPGQWSETISSIEKNYNEAFSGTTFNWYFLEDQMNKVYSNEKVTRNQILLFVVQAIVIACLGFLGMITNKVASKIKEIGIRKVLGASITHIGGLILRTSSMQFGAAILIGVPIAWYLGNEYLKKFSERIELHWWHYALPIALLIFILLATVGTVIWKAAKSNPVDALKYE